jgi:DNA processing protein
MVAMNTNHMTKRLSMADFDTKLKDVYQPPSFLYAKGNENLINSALIDEDGRPYTYICIVGARNHTEYGRYVAREIIKALRGYPVIIVSGLAIGIDTVAHETALAFDMPTIAVLGSGIDDEVLYPYPNIDLLHRILDKGGLAISEYDDTTKATRWSFPLRNRIMAGLSDAIVVIEGGSKSGTLITAKLGLDFGREVIAVPGPITSPLSQGPLSLIDQGATPLTHPAQILQILGFESPELILYEKTLRENAYERISPEERAVLDSLSAQPLDRDEIMDAIGYPIHKLQIVLTMLEIKNLIIERQGKIMRL